MPSGPNLSFFQRRAIVPGDVQTSNRSVSDPNTPDLDNVQGDVYLMFPKKWERFLFFKINNLAQFKKDLYTFAPRITSSRETAKNLIDIHDLGGDNRDIVSTGIAFAKAGLNALGISQRLGDPHFDKGSLYLESKELGDTMPDGYDQVFKGNGNSHGVILLAAREQQSCKDKMEEIKTIFVNSITVIETYEGRVRVGDGEHFGWRDGVSQPAINCDWVKPKNGQHVVKPGVIIMGYPGDPVFDDRSQLARPPFTKDGSFMVFRKLEQNVLLFEDYIEKNWVSIPPQPVRGVNLNKNQRKLLFGARMVGRFKSGTPLALCPYIDDPSLTRPETINDFNYTERDGLCPFSAHVRKVEPRAVHPVISKEFLDASVIIRAGIPYGDDVSDKERDDWNSLTLDQKNNNPCPRGLLFVCYQSSLQNGFVRQTIGFANNDFFPLTSLEPKKIGQDPIIGGPKKPKNGQADISSDGQVTLEVTNTSGDRFKVTGVAEKVDTSATAFEQEFFVTSRGGDYFFVPSISTVNGWATPN